MEEGPRLEGETLHSGKKRGVDKSSTIGHPNLYHALF